MATRPTSGEPLGGRTDRPSLPGWAEFANARLPPRTTADERFVLFHSRWRLARSFEELHAPGFSDRVRDGYSAAFKVFLAYTAHEQLAYALGLPHWAFPMSGDASLAGAIRSELAAFKITLSRDAQKRQREGLDAFWDGAHDDVRYIAYGIRNLVAHGLFTGSRIKTKSSQSVLAVLAESVLLTDESWFSDWVDMQR